MECAGQVRVGSIGQIAATLRCLDAWMFAAVVPIQPCAGPQDACVLRSRIDAEGYGSTFTMRDVLLVCHMCGMRGVVMALLPAEPSGHAETTHLADAIAILPAAVQRLPNKNTKRSIPCDGGGEIRRLGRVGRSARLPTPPQACAVGRPMRGAWSRPCLHPRVRQTLGAPSRGLG